MDKSYREIFRTEERFAFEDTVYEVLDEIYEENEVRDILEDISGLDEIDKCKEIIEKLSDKLY